MNDIKELTKEKLRELYVDKAYSRKMIARKYDVFEGKIAYLLKKYNIYFLSPKEDFDYMASENWIKTNNKITVEEFFNNLDFTKSPIEEISRALVCFCFENGPIEDMHREGKLSQADIKNLNQFCFNKIFAFFTSIKNNDIDNLSKIIELSQHGKELDKSEFTID